MISHTKLTFWFIWQVWIIEAKNPKKAHEVNVTFTKRFLNAAIKNKVKIYFYNIPCLR